MGAGATPSCAALCCGAGSGVLERSKAATASASRALDAALPDRAPVSDIKTFSSVGPSEFGSRLEVEYAEG